MLLGIGGESGCASRFSLPGLLRIVMCGGERDWLTEGSERVLAGLNRMPFGLWGCALNFSFSGSLKVVMCRGERGRLTEVDGECMPRTEDSERDPAALRRMLLGFGLERGSASRFSHSRSLRMVIRGGKWDWETEVGEDEYGS